jgi:tetratricopeptide (TPR) repeat protein
MRLVILLALVAGIAPAAESTQLIFDKAAAALSGGDYAAAESGFQRVLQVSPDHIGALGNLGVIYARTERLDQAIAVYQRALKVRPGDNALLLNLGLAYLREDSYGLALPIFRRLAQADARHRQARELLATCELYTGHVASAVQSLEKLRAEDSRNAGLLYLLGVGYLKMNRPADARQALDAFLASTPPAQTAMVLCKAYYESALFDEAVEQCRKALEIDPVFPGAHRELGKALVSQRSDVASKELELAVRQNANDAEALYFLGGILLQENRVAEAVSHLERARQLNPGFWGNYFYLAKAKFQSKSAAEALPLLEKAAELNPDESAVLYLLGRVLTALGKTGQASQAMQRVRELKALELSKDAEVVRK